MRASVVKGSIRIARSVDEVFVAVSNPPGWKLWYPSSRSVRRISDGAVEWLTPLGMPLRIRWRIQLQVSRRRIRKRGRIWGLCPIDILYTVHSEEGGTRFHRLMRYPVPPGFGKIDRILLHPYFQQE